MKFFLRKAYLVVIILSIITISIPSAADNGDGSGGGKDEPLALLSSVPANGASEVAVDTVIILGFSKNVINMSVADANRNCFVLLDASGSKIPLNVIIADDQIEPEKKRIISVKPQNKLQPGTNYTLVIYATLQSKSGVSLGKDVKIRFKTATEETAESNTADNTQKFAAETDTKPVQPNNPEDNQLTPDQPGEIKTAPITPESVDVPIKTEENTENIQTTSDVSTEKNNNLPIFIAIAIVIAILPGMYTAYNRRKK